jgi:spermidine synthase
VSGTADLATLTIVRTALAAAVMIVPTTLMGATLPIISDCFVRQTRNIGARVGLLYAVNTLGAVIGCLLSGVWLMRWLGVTNSSYLASALNVAIGAIAILWAGRSIRRPRQTSGAGAERVGPIVLTRGLAPWLAILAALFVSGFTALSYEVIWSRVLGFVFAMGTSAYAFTIVLAVVLAGLGLGSLLYAWWAADIDDSVRLFGLVQMLVGGTAFAAIFLFAQWNSPRFLEVSREGWINDFVRALFLTATPSVLMGVGFPLACRIIAQDAKTLGRPLGLAYGVNTLGCVLGPLVTGFLLIPALGTEATLKVMITANVLTGVALWTGAGSRDAALDRFRLAWAGAIVAAILAVDTSRTELVLNLFNVGNDEVVYFREGSSDSVLATRRPDGIQLIVGGSVGAGSTPPYQRTDELLAYIPLLLHSAPRDVAVVGFGTGRTSGLYAEHPVVERVDVIEIAEGALASGRDVFASFNRGALANPKVTTILDDGFNFMKYGRAAYDVVSLDPFSPRNPGSARLYTRDFLRSVKARLKEDGVVVMWAYPSSVRMASFTLALKTFQSVFPHATVWTSPVDGMFLFVATPQRLRFDESDLATRLAARPSQDRYSYHIRDAADFIGRLFLDEEAVGPIAALAQEPVFTVDRPNLEFIYLRDRSPALDAVWRRQAQRPPVRGASSLHIQ